MSKETKKSPPDYNLVAIGVLVDKYGVSAYYIKQSINGNKQGITPDSLKKEYKLLDKELKKVETETINNFLKQ